MMYLVKLFDGTDVVIQAERVRNCTDGTLCFDSKKDDLSCMNDCGLFVEGTWLYVINLNKSIIDESKDDQVFVRL